jgi:hypothetical protein
MIGASCQVQDRTGRVRKAAKQAAFRNLQHGIATIRIYAIRSLKRRSGASTPGTPPNTRGAFKRAIKFDVDKEAEEAITGFQASVVGEAGAAHEHGEEYRGDQYPERPTMGPALQANEDRGLKEASMKRIGFEGRFLWGVAGGTGATLTNSARDVGYKFEPQEADTSDRSCKTELVDVAMVKFSIELEINNQDTDAFVAAVRAATTSGGAIAIRTEDKASGWGVDGDFIVGNDESQPLKDAQRLKLNFSPTDKAGRVPTWY